MSKKRKRTEAKRKKERKRADRQYKKTCWGCGCQFTTSKSWQFYHSLACDHAAEKRRKEENQKKLEAEQDRKHQRLIERNQGVYRFEK